MASSWYPKHENTETSHRQFFSQVSNDPYRISSGPFSGVRKGEAERVRTMLENEMVLRGHYGLPPVRPMASYPYTGNDNQSLTERLVSQLIKGNERDVANQEPQDGSRGRKRVAKGPNKSQGNGTSKASSDETKFGKDQDQFERDDRRQPSGGSGKQNVRMSSQVKCGELTVRPLTFPPKRKTVEENLQEHGLNSVQPPVAFCSNEQDLPDKPIPSI